MRKAFIALAALVPVAALALATTATGSSARPAAATAIPGCATASLNLVNEGQLTVGTDNPAYPPWFGGNPKGTVTIQDPAPNTTVERGDEVTVNFDGGGGNAPGND